MRGASLDMIQEARRGGDLLVRAELLVACVGSDGRPARLPLPARHALERVALQSPGASESPRSRHIRI
jgi:acyl-CoA thioester hydrolase